MKFVIVETNVYDRNNTQKVVSTSVNGSVHVSIIDSTNSRIRNVREILKTTFLPVGYPNTVRSEYLAYQSWDCLQGLSSYLRGVLSSRSVLHGLGVGNSNASALLSALIWATKDLLGHMTSLSLAYFCSGKLIQTCSVYYADAALNAIDIFEINFKEWRLVADVLNNIGLAFDLSTSLFPNYFLLITSISTICHSCCGLIAGSTKARISQHFALNGHLADITAKESTQETAVALIGLIIGMICTKIIGTDFYSTWTVFTVLLCVHVWANYNLVKVLILDTLNPQRCYLIVKSILDKQDDISPLSISKSETLWLPVWLHVYGPLLGVSSHHILSALRHQDEIDFHSLSKVWGQDNFLIGFNEYGRIIICLCEGATESQMCKAYFTAVYLYQVYIQKFYVKHYLFMNKLPKNLIKEMYRSLLSTDAKASLDWYKESLDNNRLIASGWDCVSEKSRMGANKWRIKSYE